MSAPLDLGHSEHELRDVVAAVGFLYGHGLPQWLQERLADPPIEDLARLERLIALREDHDEEDGAHERHGFGVCITGACVEPCGDFGGCKR